ncbi:MAG: transglutaminase family protein [Pseudomonadota bacterium]
MSVIYDITHTTHYHYAQPVTIDEHRVMFRPRDSHDMRVLATDLKVTPPALEVRLIQDAYSNSVALVLPQSPATQLKLVRTFTVEHSGTPALDFPLDPQAQTYPFDYDPEERLILAPYLVPHYDDPDDQLLAWAQQFVPVQQAISPRDLLLAMRQFIHDTMQYRSRSREGVHDPLETLRLQSGSCRDFATLMIEAARRLGYAARFVSGYLYIPRLDTDAQIDARPANTHAWVEAYLPGAGWIPLDPTNQMAAGGNHLIRVNVARHASQAPPVSGSWHGSASDYLGMTVDVQVRQRH